MAVVQRYIAQVHRLYIQDKTFSYSVPKELESEISAYKELIRDLKRQISVRDNIIADVEKAICGD